MKTTAVLNFRIGPGTNFRSLGTIERNAPVAPFDRHGDWVYLGKPYLGWVHSGYLIVEAAIPILPKRLLGIINQFGKAGSPAASSGRCRLPAPLKLSWSSSSISMFACHIEMERVFEAVFQDIFESGFWFMLEDFGGCYNLRKKTASSSEFSTHSWGIAVDLNTKTNRFGTEGDMPMAIVEKFKNHGFVWGGDWKTKDPMHFQYAEGY